MKGSDAKRYVAKDGTVTWWITIDLPRNPETDKRRQRRVRGKTKPEVEAKAAQLIASIASGGFGEADASKLTVDEYLRERWLPSLQHSLKPASLLAYGNVVNKHVGPALGKVALSKLGAMQLQRFYTERMAKGLSSTTVVLIHRVLHRALKQAIRWGLLLRNPCDAVEVPREAHKEYITWTPEEAATFLRATANDELGALWRLALFTGMRSGEILGLKWADIDLGRGVIAVMHTLARGKGGTPIDGTPKTAGARRQIAVPTSVVENLRKHQVRQKAIKLELGSAYEDAGYVFANQVGKPLHSSTIGGRFARLITLAGVPRIRFHDLRHTNATISLKAGEHPKIVSERLGHSNISITLNRYSHVTPDMQRASADRFDRLIEDAS